jgi:hypothetical protein
MRFSTNCYRDMNEEEILCFLWENIPNLDTSNRQNIIFMYEFLISGLIEF